MGNLGAYLRPVPAGKTKEFYLENFKDEKGEKIPFVVKAITPKENDGIVKRNTVKGVFNNATYINEMIVTCMETPNLKDAELCSFYGLLCGSLCRDRSLGDQGCPALYQGRGDRDPAPRGTFPVPQRLFLSGAWVAFYLP